MKKTLAAVLAAAMALSTASVAFAKDTLVDDDYYLTERDTSSVEKEIAYGKDIKRVIAGLGDFGQSELAELFDDNKISVTAIVTEGSSKLDSKPSIEVLRSKNTTAQSTEKRITWIENVYESATSNKIIYRKGSVVGNIPVVYNGNSWDFGVISTTNGTTTKYYLMDDVETMKKGHENYKGIIDSEVTNATIIEESRYLQDGSTVAGNKLLQLKFKVAHTYGTGDTTIGMKLRITVKKDFTSDVTGDSYKKGNTYTTEEFKFKAKYFDVNDYSGSMQLTIPEVKDSYVLLNGEKLYDEIGADQFDISFEDTARFDAKLSSSQKKVNLYYNLDEITAITDTYPTVDFEFITFKGNPSFVNTGTMTFNAVGGKNTQVYTFDGETLTPLTTSYDSSYGTVTVKGIKKLGTFVVASEILEVEDDEDNEPVSSAPIVEESSSSQPSSNNGDRNPSTGAC